jgi:DNA-binding beta-propeller fold protein YncE
MQGFPRTLARRLWACCLLASVAAYAAPGDAPLALEGRTPLPGYDGDFDHFTADVAGHRLFLAGEDGGSLEVFDLRDGRHLRSVKNIGTPHALHYLAPENRLLVTNSGKGGMSLLLDASTFRRVGEIASTPGADAMGYDASADHVWIVAGGKNAQPKRPYTTVADVDPHTGRVAGTVTFDTDFVEGVAVEQKGARAFVNVAGASEVAVVDKRTHEVLARWRLSAGRQNSAIALDEARGRLFVVTRKPFRLVVLDTRDGRMVASMDAPQRTNDIFWDAQARRLYLTGDGYVATVAQRDADHYEELARVPSAKGAKTGFLAAREGLLYVAVAGTKDTPAAVLRYRVRQE